MRSLTWLVPLMAAASPAFAQAPAGGDATAATVPAAATPAVAAAKPKKVCRTFRVTGRRISDTYCYTAAQWAEYDRSNQQAANQFINGVTSQGARGNLSSGQNGEMSTSTMFGLGAPQ